MAKIQTDATGLRTGIGKQMALVEASKREDNRIVHRTIPAGDSMMKLSIDDMKRACWTWLRSITTFDEATIKLAKDVDKFKVKETKVQNFKLGARPIWENPINGKREVSDKVAELLLKQKLLYIKLKKDGLYVGVDAEDKFSNYKKATASDVAEAKKEDVVIGIGDSIVSPDWYPHIEFVCSQKSRYVPG